MLYFIKVHECDVVTANDSPLLLTCSKQKESMKTLKGVLTFSTEQVWKITDTFDEKQFNKGHLNTGMK